MGSGKKPELTGLQLGWLESGNTQLGPPVTDCKNQLAAICGRETPGSFTGKGTGLSAYMMNTFVDPVSISQKQTAQEKRSWS